MGTLDLMTRRHVVLVLSMLFASGCGNNEVCGSNNPCPLGSTCTDGVCRTDCVAGSACGDDEVCTRFGRCVPTRADPNAGVCGALVIEASFGVPTIVLLVDQSGSMDQAYSGGTRWNVLRDALINPTDGVVTHRQSEIRFGLTLYTGGDPCPGLTVVDPALDNRDAIAAVYEAEGPLGDTPTGESIGAVTEALAAYTEPGPKYIILASDGEPDTCAEPNPQNGQPEAVAAAEAAHTAGIDLYFLSVGSGTISQEHMQDVANAGVGLPVGGTENAPYFEAADADQLAAAFDEITSGLLSCDLTIDGEITPDAAEGGVIYLDGQPLTIEVDWEPVDETSFRLLGDACTNAQRGGDHTVTAHFGCNEEPLEGELTAEGGGFVDGGCTAVAPPGWLLALSWVFFWWHRRTRARLRC